MKVTPDSLKFLGADDAAAFEALLREFITDTGALCTMLVDRTGRMLAQAGDTAGMDGVAFASLASADFAASDQLAELLGEIGRTVRSFEDGRSVAYAKLPARSRWAA